MPESPGQDDLHARGAKNPGQPEPPPATSGGGSALPPTAHSAKNPGPPEPPPTANPDDTNDAHGPIKTGPPEPPPFAAIVSTIAALGFVAGAHALQTAMADCLNAATGGMMVLEIAALVALIMWLVQMLHAHGPIKSDPPEPPPLSSVPKNVAAALVGLSGLLGITLGVLEDCLSGLHLILGVADVVLAGWILILLSQGVNADQGTE